LSFLFNLCLQLLYMTIIVTVGSQEACALFGGQPLHPVLGHVSSVNVAQTGVGLKDCPWMIEAREGQRTSLTLFSFSSSRSLTAVCPWTMLVSEGNKTVAVAACSGGLTQRDRLVYTSEGHRLQFYLRSTSDLRTAVTDVRLIIRYKGWSSS